MNIKHNPYIMLSIIFLCLSLINHLSFGIDTISENQSLSGDQTIVSSGGNFELGFFKPGPPGKSSNKFYIGMWYKKRVSVQTIVWVANRETPISNKYSSELKILNGNLVLLNESQITVWSTNIDSTITSNNSVVVVATLLDDGNLVLKDGSSSTQQPFWQSFDHPTSALLPGSKIGFNKRSNTSQILTSWKNIEDPAPGMFSLELDPNGSPSLLLIHRNRSESYWTSGFWNGVKFSLAPDMTMNYISNYSYVSNENESYFSFTLMNPSIVARLSIDVSGQIKLLTWLDSSGEWDLFWSLPRQQCEVYAYCGPFGSCDQTGQPPCDCLRGFMPKYLNDWILDDFSGGCVRQTSLQCESNGKTDTFQIQPNMRLPNAAVNQSVQSDVECKSTCLSQCECNAYAYAYGINRCSIWYGELLNVEKSPELGRTGENVSIKLAASQLFEFSSPKNKSAIVIGSVIGSVAGSLAVMGLVFFWRWKNKHEGRNKSFKNRFVLSRRHANLLNNDVTQGGSSDVPSLQLKSIVAATDGFSVANKLGQGGFGSVYKGNLPSGQKIAVKRLSTNSGQGIREFKNEVVLISKLQHRNLVKLLGFCVEGDEKLLIYEYMPNKSLDAFLSGSSERGILDWDQRYNIIEGIARGLLYLHRDSRLRVIHRDLKPGNILLDEEMKPKISDFGMAKMFRGNQTLANTNTIAGT